MINDASQRWHVENIGILLSSLMTPQCQSSAEVCQGHSQSKSPTSCCDISVNAVTRLDLPRPPNATSPPPRQNHHLPAPHILSAVWVCTLLCPSGKTESKKTLLPFVFIWDSDVHTKDDEAVLLSVAPKERGARSNYTPAFTYCTTDLMNDYPQDRSLQKKATKK